MSETKTIYITKYALTDGIQRKTAEVDDDLWALIRAPYITSYSPRAYALTPEDAVKQAEALRSKKIDSLKKQIAKFEKLTFSVEAIR